MTGAEALRRAIPRLDAAGVPGAARDARALLAHAMGLAQGRIGLHLNDVLDAQVLAAFDALVTARAARQPVSQIIGGRLFWGRWFRVTPAVLDPRPETETLIAAALSAPFARVLDLGTGSGAILLTLLAERAGATGLGTDLSPDALVVAQANAQALGLADRAEFRASDWLADVQGPFDLVVSNPPYVTQAEMAALSPEVRDWEPHLALTPGGDGLAAYRAILAGVGRVLVPNGQLLLEIGHTQGAAVSALCATAGLSGIRCLQDMDGRDRVVSALASTPA